MSPMKTARTLLADKQRPALRSSLPRLQPSQRTISGSASKTLTAPASRVVKNDSADGSALKTDNVSGALRLPRNDAVKGQKENLPTRSSLPRRKSKSDDPAIGRLSGPSSASAATSFRTPPTVAAKKRLLTSSMNKFIKYGMPRCQLLWLRVAVSGFPDRKCQRKITGHRPSVLRKHFKMPMSQHSPLLSRKYNYHFLVNHHSKRKIFQIKVKIVRFLRLLSVGLWKHRSDFIP